MNIQLVLILALVFGYVFVDSREPTSSTSKRLISSIVEAITGGFKPLPHVVGGNEAEPHSHPHQAAVLAQLEGGDLRFCGGSLIAPQWVLTAAHCMEEANKAYTILGAHDFSLLFEWGRQMIHVEKIVRHENWDNCTFVNDIALLQLASTAVLDENVQIIRLPSSAFRSKSLWRKPVVMTGWGKYSDNKDAYSSVLRSTKSSVTTNFYCNWKYEGNIKSTMVCVDGSKKRGVCSGDSGGPLITTELDGKRTLIGVTSFGAKIGCEVGYPTVFTRVSQYLEWIANNTGTQLREE